jgi:hypothetical protein
MNVQDYQKKILRNLQCIFPNEPVETEWDSVKYDPHFSNHKEVYAPIHDLAVGPFNFYADLDRGIDNTKGMKSHPFTKRLVEPKLESGLHWDKLWNSLSRCFLAVEIEFSGSLKHMLGSIVNASVSGSIGIVVASNHNRNKIDRLVNYLFRLEYLERLKLNTIGNLFVFDEEDFSKFLSEFVSTL